MGITPVLDLDALAPTRPVVRIRTETDPDGLLYEMRIEDEMTLSQMKQLEVLGTRVLEFWDENSKTMDEAEVKLFEGWIDECFDINDNLSCS